MRPFDAKSYLVDVLGPYAGGSGTDTPDLFERYLLEPSDNDDAAIATRLGDVKALWDKRIEHPKYGQLIRTLLAAHLEAELTLCDPGERGRLAAESADRERERTHKTAQALENWRNLVAEHVRARGGLDPAQRGQLERMATKQGLDPGLVKRELDKVPVAKMPDVLDKARRQRVRKSLSELARDMGEPRLALSLFHAVGLEVTQEGALVLERYESVSKENNQRKIGTTASLFKTVLAEVKLLLIDADPRSYIEGLVADVKEDMEFQGVAAASDNVIDPEEAEQLLRTALELGLTPELGQRVVRELAQQNGVSIQTGAAVDYVACPSCNRPHPRQSAPESCTRCATALFVVCPADECNTRNEATAAHCSRCGIDLHRYTDATRRLVALSGAVSDGRVAWATGELAEIARVLGDAKVSAEVRRTVEDAERSARTQWTRIESAIADRRLFAARTELRTLRKQAGDVAGPSGDYPAVRLEEVERRLVELDAALTRARAASGSAREQALVDALGLAADCAEAAAALNAIAPEPTGRVDIQMGPRGPVVSWLPSPTIAARYTLQRTDVRTGAVTSLGETADTTLDDGDAATGALVRYEVSTIRGESRSPASASPPLIVAREVEGLSMADGDGEVRVTWQPVPSSARVLVFRKDASGGEEQELVADRSGLVDRSVENGRRYGYRIIVEYSRDGAQTQRTTGLTVFGQPAPPPEGIEELTVRAVPNGVMIEFEPPPIGSIAVLRCSEEPKVALGESVDPERLTDFGQVLATEGRGARDTSSGGICWYLPITIAGGTAVSGRARRHLALTEIANVKAVQHAREVRVTWEWPDRVRLAKVIWRHDCQPDGPDDPAAESAWMRLGEYRDHGGFVIEAPGTSPVFIAVVPGIRADGALLAGTTIPRAARAVIRPTTKVDLRYNVRRTGMRKKRLEVRVEAPIGSDPPGLVLVVRPGDLLPRHASDGEVIARLGGGEPLTSTVDLDGRSRPLAVRLFLSSTGASGGFQLSDPTPDDLLIS